MNYRDRCLKEIFRNTQKRARKFHLKFKITEKYLKDLWDLNEGKCGLTQIEFSDKIVGKTKRRPYAASLDRIDSNEGYTIKNTRLICQAVNMALFVWGDDVFDNVVFHRLRQIKQNKHGECPDELKLKLGFSNLEEMTDIKEPEILENFVEPINASPSPVQIATDPFLEPIERPQWKSNFTRTPDERRAWIRKDCIGGLAGRMRTEQIFELPTGWFNMREKYGQTNPRWEKINGFKHYFYDIEKVESWIKENPEAQKWSPPGYEIRISTISNDPYFFKLKQEVICPIVPRPAPGEKAVKIGE